MRHLHAFASEVQLTEEEWFAAIDFLTRTGHITDDKRQEFVLASDTLGLSMLVVGMNHRRPPGATEPTVFGPFFIEGSPAFENGDDLANGAPGTPCFMSGTVRSTDGEAIPGALLDIWQADEDGFYDVQYEGLDEARGRGHLHSADDGRYWFWTAAARGLSDPDRRPGGQTCRGDQPQRDAPGARPLQGHLPRSFRPSSRTSSTNPTSTSTPTRSSASAARCWRPSSTTNPGTAPGRARDDRAVAQRAVRPDPGA